MDDINTYKFDFKRDTKALQDFVGAPAGNLIYIDVGTDPQNPDKSQRAFARNTAYTNEALYNEAKDDIAKIDMQDFAADPLLSSLSRAIVDWDRLDADSGTKVPHDVPPTITSLDEIKGFKTFINEADFNHGFVGAKFTEILKLFTLYHETGHGLAKIDELRDEKPATYREGSADAYAALLLIKRFGQQAIPFLNSWSWLRATMSLSTGDTSHLTSTILDKVIADSQRQDFSTLTSAQALEKAKGYAEQWTPDADALKKVYEAGLRIHLAEPGADPIGQLISNTDLSGYAPGNLALYVVLKNAVYRTQPGMRVDSSYKEFPLDVAQAQRIVNAAKGMSFASIFNKAAAPKVPPAATVPARTASAPGMQP